MVYMHQDYPYASWGAISRKRRPCPQLMHTYTSYRVRLVLSISLVVVDGVDNAPASA